MEAYQENFVIADCFRPLGAAAIGDEKASYLWGLLFHNKRSPTSIKPPTITYQLYIVCKAVTPLHMTSCVDAVQCQK